jgi:hypothetical protein
MPYTDFGFNNNTWDELIGLIDEYCGGAPPSGSGA